MENQRSPSSRARRRPRELLTASEVAHFATSTSRPFTTGRQGRDPPLSHARRHLRFRRGRAEFRQVRLPGAGRPRSGKPKVVAIDDDPHMLASIRRALGRRFEVTTFKTPSTRWSLSAGSSLTPCHRRPDEWARRYAVLEACGHRGHLQNPNCRLRRSSTRGGVLEAGASDSSRRATGGLREALERLTAVDRA
jgi:hypothetical protein